MKELKQEHVYSAEKPSILFSDIYRQSDDFFRMWIYWSLIIDLHVNKFCSGFSDNVYIFLP